MSNQKPLQIALLGLGTVGTGVAIILRKTADLLAKRAGRPLRLAKVLYKDPHKKRETALSPDQLAASLDEILNDPSIDVVVEVAGGTTWAFDEIGRAHV